MKPSFAEPEIYIIYLQVIIIFIKRHLSLIIFIYYYK